MICYFRDEFPDLPCPLHRMGSDCCEEFFSKNVQFVGNHPLYPFGQMVRNVGHMIRLSQILADPDALKFARAHVKQENVWERQFNENAERASLQEYPLPGEEVKLWEEGITMARNLAASLGITNDYFYSYDYDRPENPGDWFRRPFSSGDHEVLFSRLKEDSVNYMYTEDENADDWDDSTRFSGSQRPAGKCYLAD